MTTQIELYLDGRERDAVESWFDPSPIPGWHPMEYMLAIAENVAADAIGGEEADAKSLGITATTDFVPGKKWSVSFAGEVFQHGRKAGRFEATSRYQFD